MNPIRLNSEVTIRGPDFWGKQSFITFYPTDKEKGWRWKTKNGVVLISPSIVQRKMRRFKIYSGSEKIEVFEHIGLLRYFGLCNLMIESSPWPPYYGSGFKFWEAIKPFCSIDNSSEIPWYTIKTPVRWAYPKSRNGYRAFTEIQPNKNKRLEIEVIYSLPGGVYTQCFSFPDDKLLEKICQYNSQGLSDFSYYMAKVISLFGWPHFEHIAWRHQLTQENALKCFTIHRAADLLGALCLLCRDGLLSAKIISRCSGHEADIQAILKADKQIYRL